MVTVKSRPLPTRALGAEPGVPDVAALAGWVAERRECGEAGDLTTYFLGQALAPQADAGISIPCTGGKFYGNRLLSSFAGIEEGIITGETGISVDDLVADATEIAIQKKGVWCAAPAPHLLNLADTYYGDEEEASTAVSDMYRSAMRAMRDAGTGGHILICDRADERELLALSRQKVFFFLPKPGPGDLELLLEHQNRIAVNRINLPDVLNLSNEFDLRQIIIVDADAPSIALSLSNLDPDQILAGGYCTESCETYWKDLIKRAFYTA